MRGQRIFNEYIKDNESNKAIVKGRNNKLVTKRNECLVARYYYYGHYKKMFYEEIIRQLVGEFFIAPNTIVNIIQENTDQLQFIKLKPLPLYYFQNHWPHFKW